MSTAIQRVGSGFALAPSNMQELFRFAEMVAASDLVPKDYRDKPGNVAVAIQMGGELGLSPMQSVQNIAVINGRPSLWGDALLAVCLPHLDTFEESDDGTVATCVATRGKRRVSTTFSMEDAKRAGLAGKSGPWTQYPARMRKMRARGFTLRDICADILRGIHSAEEAQDIPREVRAEVTSSKAVEEPKTEAPKTEPKQESKPVGPVFWPGWTDKTWAGRLLTEADSKTLCDYIEFLSALIEDPKRARLKEGAEKSRDAAQKVIDDRMAAEADKALAIAEAKRAEAERDPINDELDKLREPSTGGEGDQNPAWGLEAPQ